MSEKWNDVFFRATQNDKGERVLSGSVNSCFDIITRTEPYKDLNDLTTKDGWEKNESQELTAKMNNFIYVRGTNLADKPQSGSVYLYYTPASLLLYPGLWKNNIIKVGDKDECFTFKNLEKGQQTVFADIEHGTFSWRPDPLSRDHYCLISRVSTADHPAQIEDIKNIDDFGEFISTNRSFGWRNISVTDRNSPQWSMPVHYEQGDTGSVMHFILSCKNAPVGTEVALSCPSGGPNPPIHMPRTKITEPNQDLGVICDVPANFSGEITYYFWSNNIQGGANMEIALHAVYFVQDDHKLCQYAKHHKELGFKFSNEQCRQLKLGKSIGPEKGIILGQHTTQIR